MIIIIAAVCIQLDGRLGIGKDNGIPWDIPEDRKFFKQKTTGHTVLMGRKTFNSLGNKPLPNRNNIVLSNSLELNSFNNPNLDCITVDKLDSLNKKFINDPNNHLYIIGGSEIYNMYSNIAYRIILNYIFDVYNCDVFFPIDLDSTKWVCENIYSDNISKYQTYDYFNGDYYSTFECNYLDLLKNILKNGNNRSDRTGTGTLSLFGKQLTIDIKDNIPLLTTKRVAWKTCIKELLWFLRGETDSKILQEQGVHIWDGNTSREFLDSRGLYHYPEGELGKGYGYQIRYCGGTFPEKQGGVDQLKYIEDLLLNDPFSRRIMWDLWTPTDLNEMALYPCHYSFQLYTELIDGEMYLSGLVNLRSSDVFLGLPFNIFSYSVLIYILALKYNMKPNKLTLNLGDSHIYLNHIKQVETQLTRKMCILPTLKLNDSIKTKDYHEITIDDFTLKNYYPQAAIKADMAI